MILVAGGDSFTYGSELQDSIVVDPTESVRVKESLSTFPALLAKELGMDYCCAAYPGFSNSAIRRTVMNTCEKLNDIGLVLVTWSFPGRYEFRFNYDTGERWGNWYSITPWTTHDDIDKIKEEFYTDNPAILEHHINNLKRAKRTGVSDFAKAYYQHVGSSGYWEVYNSLCDIVLLQQYLERKGLPYIFSLVDEAIFSDIKLWSDENIITLWNQIDFDRWVLFENNQGFYTWARDYKYPMGTTHPLEPAHKDAFKHITQNYSDLLSQVK